VLATTLAFLVTEAVTCFCNKPPATIDFIAPVHYSVSGQECPICLDTHRRLRRTRCGHLFCDACAQRWFHESLRCPLCNETVLSESEHQLVQWRSREFVVLLA
jgi:hypothetical protein